MSLEMLEGKCLKWERVGSRVTCDPAPTDTDEDILVLTTAQLWGDLSPALEADKFEKGGSDCGDQSGYLAANALSFQSFTLGQLNLIITFDPEFYRRFMAATGVAKRLNLLDKTDRIVLFQAVIYGNAPIESPPWLPTAPVETVGAYWVEFDDRFPGCVEALNHTAAMDLAEQLTGVKAKECHRLPYPANPRLNRYAHASHGVCPAFCYTPATCKGRGSCPHGPACTE